MNLPTGMSARGASIQDAAALAELQNSVFIDEIGLPYTSVAEMVRALTFDKIDPPQDVIIIHEGDRMVGSSLVHTEDPFERISIDGFVRPSDTGRGIGTCLMTWAEERARQLAMQHPTHDPPPLVQHWAADPSPLSRAFLEAHDFGLERWFHHMEIDLGQPAADPSRLWPLPPSISIRPIELIEVTAVWEASNEAFRDHWGHVEVTEEQFRHFMVEREDFDASLWFVAVTDDGTVAGDCLCFINDQMGELRGLVDDVAVRRPWRGKGVASQLLAISLDALRERGIQRGQLFVDSENPTGALGVYERAGMYVARSFSNYAKPLT